MKKYCDYLKRLPSKYTFGIELEFTGGLSSDETEIIINYLIEKGYIREGWSVHYDKSVVDENDKGAEIVSPVLTDTKQTERELDIILKVIKMIGGKMTDKVGCHIHYGTQCLGENIKNIQNFFKLYTINEPLLYKMSKGDLDSVRVGCYEFAKPIQKRLMNVIDSKINSFTELMVMLSINLGANPTHYGENRYYGLNIQRIIEAIRSKPLDTNLEEYIRNIFKGVEQYDKEGKKISPTIEIRYRNGSSSVDEIMCGVRINGQMFVASKSKGFSKNPIIKSQYRNVKKRKKYVFDKVLRANRESDLYAECVDDDEILRKKFAESIYEDGVIDKNSFVEFMSILYPDLSKKIVIEIYNKYVNGLKPTEYKKEIVQSKNSNITISQGRQYVRTAA